MPLDPKAREFLDQMAALGGPTVDQLSPLEARAAVAGLFAMQAEASPVAQVTDRRIPGPAGEIAVRVYTPAGTAPLPVLVFLHGGGWVLGDLDSHDGPCRVLANAVPALVVAVDYRLAPEHPFPAAAEDAYAAVRWVAESAGALGGDPTRIAVAGDSAGGNLSAVVALMARDRGGPRLALQVLIYPATDTSFDTASYRDNGDGYFLTGDMMRWFLNHYLGATPDRQDAYAAPLRAKDLHGLPPALVLTAEFDPLRDEGEAYAARLREAGVPVSLRRYDGMIHGFVSLMTTFPQARLALEEAAAALRAAFARTA